ncbi:MAG: DUF3465 domain-containing protein [Phycisphaerales bacterium]
MTPKSKSTNQPKKRGVARAGAAFMIRGISKYLGVGKSQSRRPSKAKSSGRAPSSKRLARTQRNLVKLAKAHKSGEMVQFDARIVKTLPDDLIGDKHQRFIIAVDFMPSPIETVLIAHNIDLAPRIPAERGAIARFYGQYEYNSKGGLLHWTHHDPSNWREGGWIEIHRKRYE